jgi:hypothetical protein
MRKIPTLYVRDPDTNLKHVKNEVHPACQWVLDGEGTATYKWNGTAVRITEHGLLWKRREIKRGRRAPAEFVQEGEADPTTGKVVGWVLCDMSGPDDKWHIEGLGWLINAQPDSESWPNGDVLGTYELVGPKVQGNPHGFDEHRLIRHGELVLNDVPVEFDKLAEWLHWLTDADPGFEGVVWHHPDGRYAKIKAKDFPQQ